MKKILGFILIILVMSAMLFNLVACGDNTGDNGGENAGGENSGGENAGEGTGNEETGNEEGTGNEGTENEEGDTSEEECQHVWCEESLNDGIMTYVCDECGDTRTEDKTELYITACQKIVETTNALSPTQPTGMKESDYIVSLLSASDDLYVDASAMDYIQVKGVVAFVSMLADMMDNESFSITFAPVQFTYSYERFSETGTATLMYRFDEANNKVVMYWDVQSTMSERTTDIFLYIDADYDFETNTVIAFTVQSIQESPYGEMILSYKYENDVLKTLDHNADLTGVTAEINEKAALLAERADEILDLDADFTEEYTIMMDTMNG